MVPTSYKGSGPFCQPGAELRGRVGRRSPWVHGPGLQREKKVLRRHRLLLQTVSYLELLVCVEIFLGLTSTWVLPPICVGWQLL